MRDKRSVDELSIEELEQVLAIRKREARQGQLKRMKRAGRVVTDVVPRVTAPVVQPAVAPATPAEPTNGQPAPSVESAPEKPANGSPKQLKASPPPITKSAEPRFEDEIYDEAYQAEFHEDGDDRIWKRFVNTVLLIVEVAAVFGLIFIGLNLLGAIDTLDAETRAAQEMANATRQASLPTIAPTPTLRLDQVVLPSGHTFTENGTPIINTAEIPAHLLPIVQSELLAPVIARPPRTPETALAISIPKLNIDQTIIQGTDWEALKQGVGQVQNGATPADDTGNVALAAHNDIYGELFRHLNELEPGDQFQIRTETGIHTYTITSWDIFEPDDVHVMDNQGRPTATLISCYPYQVSNRRIVVFAERTDV
jgi:sortase A